MVKTINKECVKHGITPFAKTSNGYFRCKKCRVDAVVKRRRKVKTLLVEYAGGKCVKCGYSKHQAVLEFHHLEPHTKEFGLGTGGLTKSIKKLKEEADKCILVCANCHREIHVEEDAISQ